MIRKQPHYANYYTHINQQLHISLRIFLQTAKPNLTRLLFHARVEAKKSMFKIFICQINISKHT